MKAILLMLLGAMLGASGRYYLCCLLLPQKELATLLVNLLGCFLMGLVSEQLLPPSLRLALTVGFLGSFTTFSTFALDAVGLWQKEKLLLALLYTLASVLLGLLGLILGRCLGFWWTNR